MIEDFYPNHVFDKDLSVFLLTTKVKWIKSFILVNISKKSAVFVSFMYRYIKDL